MDKWLDGWMGGRMYGRSARGIIGEMDNGQHMERRTNEWIHVSSYVGWLDGWRCADSHFHSFSVRSLLDEVNYGQPCNISFRLANVAQFPCTQPTHVVQREAEIRMR